MNIGRKEAIQYLIEEYADCVSLMNTIRDNKQHRMYGDLESYKKSLFTMQNIDGILSSWMSSSKYNTWRKRNKKYVSFYDSSVS